MHKSVGEKQQLYRREAQPNLTIPQSGRHLVKAMADVLQSLINHPPQSPLSSEFTKAYSHFLELLDKFHGLVVEANSGRITCTRGCFMCCFHWVEDVYSFEAERISHVLSRKFPKRIPKILLRCRTDNRCLEKLYEKLIGEEMYRDESRRRDDNAQIDELLNRFYTLSRPCPLLDSRGDCIVYAFRPLTCRSYFSLSPPLSCDPESLSHRSTMLLEPGEKVNVLLDELHFIYRRCANDTGLRSLLMQYLGGEPTDTANLDTKGKIVAGHHPPAG